jgi:hypothetical protein
MDTNRKLKDMINKIANGFDWQMAILNVSSLGSVVAWATEYASGFAGGFVLLTVGILNLAKAYSTIKKTNNETK